jgi:hypothetical protein
MRSAHYFTRAALPRRRDIHEARRGFYSFESTQRRKDNVRASRQQRPIKDNLARVARQGSCRAQNVTFASAKLW